MRVVYYTRPAYLDATLPFVRAVSHLVELHLVLELSPEAWQSSLFDLTPRELPSGIVPADPILKGCLPAGVRRYWGDAASFNLVVHNCSRSIHPRTWRVSRKAVQFIRGLKPDLLHLDDVSLRLSWALPELGELATVLSVHDPEPHSGEGGWRVGLARWLTFRRARHFILHNGFQRELFCQLYPMASGHVSVIPLGVYDVLREWIDSPVAADERTVLFFGRLSPYKGLEVLYQAAPLVAERVPNVRFVVAGRVIAGYHPPEPPPLQNGGVVDVVDTYISNSDLAQLFQRATVVVCPYTDATQSGVVLTAYTFGKSVVATAVGGIPEYVRHGETGMLVPPRDPERLSAALADMLTDAPFRKRMEHGVRRFAGDHLGWDMIVQQTAELYERVLSP